MERMAKWIKKPVDPRFFEEPWMYQGASDGFLAPTDDIPAASEEWGIDYEGEIAVITTAVPYGATPAQAAGCIALGDALQRRVTAQHHPARTLEGLRFRSVEARKRVFSRRRDTGRTRQRVARESTSRRAAFLGQWRSVRRPRCRRDGPRLRQADSAYGAHTLRCRPARSSAVGRSRTRILRAAPAASPNGA